LPGAESDFALGLEFVSRALAREIDRGRGIAGGREQAAGTANDFNPVISNRIDLAVLIAEHKRHPDAVVLEVGDVKTACGEINAVGFHALDIHAGGGIKNGVNVVLLKIIHLRARDHRNGLRRFFQIQIQPSR